MADRVQLESGVYVHISELEAAEAERDEARQAGAEWKRIAEAYRARVEETKPQLGRFAQMTMRAEAAEARVARLEEAARQFVAWDDRWPDNMIHSASKFNLCHKELKACVDEFRAALASGDGVDCPAGLEDQCCGFPDACRTALSGEGGEWGTPATLASYCGDEQPHGVHEWTFGVLRRQCPGRQRRS